MRYIPAQATPKDTPNLVRYLFRELGRIAQAINFLPANAPTLNVEPERPQEGDFIIADGVNFDPGSGNGLYIRLNSAWVFIT